MEIFFSVSEKGINSVWENLFTGFANFAKFWEYIVFLIRNNFWNKVSLNYLIEIHFCLFLVSSLFFIILYNYKIKLKNRLKNRSEICIPWGQGLDSGVTVWEAYT